MKWMIQISKNPVRESTTSQNRNSESLRHHSLIAPWIVVISTLNRSKNWSGVNLKVVNKVVPVYTCPCARPRCLVYLLDLIPVYIYIYTSANFLPKQKSLICSTYIQFL